MRRRFDLALQRWRSWPRWVRWPLAAGTGCFAFCVLAFAFLWMTVDLPDQQPLPQSSVIVAADGQELSVVAPEGLRTEVTLDEVAPVAVDAVIAAEDRRFYQHSAIDPIGMARALWNDVRNGRTQGGSTITQQLVKVEYLSSERTITRKLREAVLALKLERTRSKDEILERYLNAVYFGRNAYGIEAAARVYFGVPAADLNLPQAALLAGLIRAPESAEPAEDPEEATRRRHTVLAGMVETGAITQQEADAADATPLGAIAEHQEAPTANLAPHFVDFVRQQAIEALGEQAVFGGGLRIVTTLDVAQQQAAEAAVAEILTEPDDPQAALVALDTDGAVRAYVGGRDYATLQVDLVRGLQGGGSGRQPGSTFKPFVLAAAMADGVTLGDRYSGPGHIAVDVNGAPWEVDNYGDETFGALTVTEATANSVNTVYAQLLAEVGPQAVADAAHAAGLTSDLDIHPSIALGAEEVSPLELANAYLTFANDGNRVEPYAIVRIEGPGGAVLWEPDRPEPDQSIDQGISRAVTYALEQVIDHGTGRAADINRPAAGKTGTTQQAVDAWFAGYVPGYSAVVWMGYADGARPMEDVHGRTVTGGSFPAQIWQRFMTAAMDGREVADFPDPPDELLAGGPAPGLSVSPNPALPGDTVTVSGSGFDLCVDGWSVAIEGTPLVSPTESGSEAADRSATFALPADFAPGPYGVDAHCDSGGGMEVLASAMLTVEPAADTTTSSSPSSTSTPPDSTTSSTRPPRSTTTSTTGSSTTSSTAPPTTAPP